MNNPQFGGDDFGDGGQYGGQPWSSGMSDYAQWSDPQDMAFQE